MSSNNILNIINPPAHIIQMSAEQKQLSQIKLGAAPVSTMCEEEAVRYLTHNISNNLHPNGRINFNKNPKDKQCVALSISPYAEIFEKNIEEKIKPLVLAFKSKRYLTCSSC